MILRRSALWNRHSGNFEAFLHQHSLRATDVRKAIVKAILAHEGHFDIETLVRDLRAKGIDASRASVYRSLPLLREAGIIHSTVQAGERRTYESAVGHDHHDHLICTRCEKMVEFHFEAFEVLQREVAAKYGFTLTDHSHELYGLCSVCRRKGRRS